MTTARIFAPAKVNLTLHITGRRDDGYHLIDSLVVFADVGDVVTLRDSGGRAFTLSGPEARTVPTNDDNSVVQVAAEFWHEGPLNIGLEKNLPTAAGIGGGSADAAACYRGVTRLLSMRNDMPVESIANVASVVRLSQLGADHVMCVMSLPVRARGIGTVMEPAPALPELPAVLVNPRIAVPTQKVFAALEHRNNAPMEDPLPEFPTASALAEWLADQRNDLQLPALKIAPQIATVMAALERSDGLLFNRMSGSGATCFGIYASPELAQAAAVDIGLEYEDWWVRSCTLGDQSASVTPEIS